MPEFNIGESVLYVPPFGLPKSVIVMSSDDPDYINVQFTDVSDFAEFRELGFGEVVNEMDRIGRVRESSLHYDVPNMYAPSLNALRNNNPVMPSFEGGRQRRRRPSSRSRRRRSYGRRRLSRRH